MTRMLMATAARRSNFAEHYAGKEEEGHDQEGAVAGHAQRGDVQDEFHDAKECECGDERHAGMRGDGGASVAQQPETGKEEKGGGEEARSRKDEGEASPVHGIHHAGVRHDVGGLVDLPVEVGPAPNQELG